MLFTERWNGWARSKVHSESLQSGSNGQVLPQVCLSYSSVYELIWQPTSAHEIYTKLLFNSFSFSEMIHDPFVILGEQYTSWWSSLSTSSLSKHYLVVCSVVNERETMLRLPVREGSRWTEHRICVKCRSVFCCRRMLLLVLVLVAPLTAANLIKPPLIMKHRVCSDLCTSGLGGAACGQLCNDDLVLELRSHLKQQTVALPQQHHVYGPRRAVCPLLCRNHLGDPLCSCHVSRWEALAGMRSQCSDWLWAAFLVWTGISSSPQSPDVFGDIPSPTLQPPNAWLLCNISPEKYSAKCKWPVPVPRAEVGEAWHSSCRASDVSVILCLSIGLVCLSDFWTSSCI